MWVAAAASSTRWATNSPAHGSMSDMAEPLATGTVVLVPVGSWEQHGPHLPFDTDTVIAVAVARRAAERMSPRPIVAAPLAYSSSGEHSGFAGTISIGAEATTNVLVELIRSCDWARGVVLVNGHGGNLEVLRRVAETATREGRRVATWSPRGDDARDTHAGHTETSVMLALAPDSVRLDLAVAGDTRPLDEIIGQMRRAGVRAVSPNGVLGDPTTATAAAGESIIDSWTSDLVATIVDWLGADA